MRVNTHSFIVRIWYEAVDEQGQAIAWRGSVEHVGSGHRLHFDQLEEFIDFIREEGGIENSGPNQWWRSLVDRMKS